MHKIYCMFLCILHSYSLWIKTAEQKGLIFAKLPKIMKMAWHSPSLMLLYSCGKENRRKRNKQEKTTHTFIDMKREVIIMTKTTVFLQAINDVKEFVNIVMKYDFDIDLVSGRYAIDAKSIMGIFSLDLSKPIQLNAHTDDAEDLLKDLNKFIVK